MKYDDFLIRLEKNMENIANEWCKKHHAILLRCCKNGFYYMNANGDWYISYNEM